MLFFFVRNFIIYAINNFLFISNRLSLIFLWYHSNYSISFLLFKYFAIFCVKIHLLISISYEPSCPTKSRSRWSRAPTSATTHTLSVRRWSWDTPTPSRIPRPSTPTSDYWKRSWTSAAQYSITTASTWISGCTPSLFMSAWMKTSSCFGPAPSHWFHKDLRSKSLICILRPGERLHYVRSCVSTMVLGLYTIFKKKFSLKELSTLVVDEKGNCF